MNATIRIGTRESELAIWQANLVKDLLSERGYASTLVFIQSEGDIDVRTPLYEMGVQGIFTKALDLALLDNSIDIAVHSMKDVPTQLPVGLVQAAVLQRGNHKDIFVSNINKHSDEARFAVADIHKKESYNVSLFDSLRSADEDVMLLDHSFIVGTSSIRRKAQWLHRYPKSTFVNLRGNMNTRMRKLTDSPWDGAIFAAAGLERINLRPKNSIDLDWMLPAPAQGAIVVVCRELDEYAISATAALNNEETAICTKIERDFLRLLQGGCSTPISAFAQFDKDDIFFKGNIVSVDGKQKVEVEKYVARKNTASFGDKMAIELLKGGGQEIADGIRNEK